MESPKLLPVDLDHLDHGSPSVADHVQRPRRCNRSLDRVPQLANEKVQLAHIEAGLAIVLPTQLQKGESILVGSKATVDRLVQIDETAVLSFVSRRLRSEYPFETTAGTTPPQVSR
jgi:hypothetical protein